MKLSDLFPFIRRRKVADSKPVEIDHDPLDPRAERGWKVDEEVNFIPKSIDDYPVYIDVDSLPASVAMDAAVIKAVKAMDDGQGNPSKPIAEKGSEAAVPNAIAGWFMNQTFIGYQACALIAQHWLVDKACSQAGEDAVRNGWKLKATGTEEELDKEEYDKLVSHDVDFKLSENLAELNRFKNIFGIRVALFEVDSDDPKYYEKPFNIDGVTEGSYRGISQVDPYWMTPMLTNESTADPANKNFYDPEFWIISGKKYHRSHLIIARGPQPADILKPTYVFGGIPLTQRIYERIYAAERTANEAPLLALNKRTQALHVDVEKALANQDGFERRLGLWVKYRDNHAVKVLGTEEKLDQFDTSLSDFDAVIMNQFQLVAAIAKTPSTKLLGTSPKGFDATGEFEMKSYHEELESIQTHTMMPMLSRHYLLMARSMGLKTQVMVVFEPVDSITTQQKADLNDKKADTDTKYVNIGAISPEEVRQRLKDDKHSGYNRLTDDTANEEPGMSPENLAKFEEAGAKAQQANAQATVAASQPPSAPLPVNAPVARQPATEQTDEEVVQAAPKPVDILRQIAAALAALQASLTPAGVDISKSDSVGVTRTSTPGVQPSIGASVSGIASVVKEKPAEELPTLKIGDMVVKVENPSGSIRSGQSADGETWSIKMDNHYGFINGTRGADGDEVDCFVGPNHEAPSVYVVNQNKKDGQTFDEHKCMVGFDSEDAAKVAYMGAYSPGWNGYRDMVPMTMEQFKEWLSTGDLTQPARTFKNGI